MVDILRTCSPRRGAGSEPIGRPGIDGPVPAAVAVVGRAARSPVGRPAGRSPGDLDVDVAVVGRRASPGCGRPTRWLVADPVLRVAVLEAEVAGFGASGRNGGWCSALFAASDARIARDHGADAGPGHAPGHAGRPSTRSAGRRRPRGSTADFAKGGTVVAARSPAQVAPGPATRWPRPGPSGGRGRPALARRRRGRERCSVPTGVLGATYTPHCAALEPARLARGLADAVERRGGRHLRGHPVTAIDPGGPGRPADGRRAGRRRCAPTWWSGPSRDGRPTLPGERRTLVPVYSLMIATEPLPTSFWARPGWPARETFSDHRHLIIYGQRTADGRLAFGGRGAPVPLRLGHPAGASTGDPGVHRALDGTLVELFPDLAGAADHPPLGRTARGAARLVLLGRPRPSHRARLGRRLRRRRGLDHQSGRPDPGRPHHGHRQPTPPAALGGPPLARAGSPSRCAGSGSTLVSGRSRRPTGAKLVGAGRHGWRPG